MTERCPRCGAHLARVLVEVDYEPDQGDVRRKAWQLEEDRALLREARGDDEA